MSDVSMTTNKTCLECGEPLGAGRDDRKFCNDICRTAFNNKRRKGPVQKPPNVPLLEFEDQWTRRVYEVLLKNRNILYGLVKVWNMDDIPLRDLLGRGFNLRYFTSVYQAPDDETYHFCFEYGYHVHGEQVYLLTRAEEAQIG